MRDGIVIYEKSKKTKSPTGGSIVKIPGKNPAYLILGIFKENIPHDHRFLVVARDIDLKNNDYEGGLVTFYLQPGLDKPILEPHGIYLPEIEVIGKLPFIYVG